MTEGLTLADLVLTAGVAFFLGSIPTAWMVARSRGVSIFSVGTRQAGATNVYREVGLTAAIIVGVIDLAKGSLAVVVGMWSGLEGSWLLLPAVAAIMGHWNSPMTRFRGGDGAATGVGVLIAISPTGAILPILVASVVALSIRNRVAHPSPWGALAGFITLNTLTAVTGSGINGDTAIGMTLIAASIFLHSYAYHRRQPGAARIDVLDDVLDGEHPDRTRGPHAPA